MAAFSPIKGLCYVSSIFNSSTVDVYCVTCMSMRALFITFWGFNPMSTRDQARGRLGRNGCPRSQNFALNGTQGEVGVSLKKKKNFFYFFFRETLFHSVTTQTQAVVTIYYHCIVFLLPFNGNSMCNS